MTRKIVEFDKAYAVAKKLVQHAEDVANKREFRNETDKAAYTKGFISGILTTAVSMLSESELEFLLATQKLQIKDL